MVWPRHALSILHSIVLLLTLSSSSSGCERPCLRPDSAVLGGLGAGAGEDLGELSDPILGFGQLRSILVVHTQLYIKCKDRT